MANYFLPSCKVKQAYPKESERLSDYLKQKANMDVIGCCRSEYHKFSEDDIVYVICHNCAQIVKESSNALKVCYVWEIIDLDEAFPFPDYEKTVMALQDCWLSHENQDLKKLIYRILHKLNIQIIDLKDSQPYCGRNLLHKPIKSNELLAPHLWCEKAPVVIKDLDDIQQVDYLKQYCQSLPTDKVVCSCRSCAEGIKTGGYEAFHLLELLFKTEKNPD